MKTTDTDNKFVGINLEEAKELDGFMEKLDKEPNRKLTAREIMESPGPIIEDVGWKMPPIDKILEDRGAPINRPAQPPEVHEPNQNKSFYPGELVKLTKTGIDTLFGQNHFVDLNGIFFVEQVDVNENRYFYGPPNITYVISQDGKRVAFYDNENVCLEKSNDQEFREWEKSKWMKKHNEADELPANLKPSGYNKNFYVDGNANYGFREDYLKPKYDYPWKASIPKPERRGHKLTKIFQPDKK